MAGPTKKPRKPEEPTESGDESMSEESDEGTYHGQQEVQATFEGRNPERQDFHGIKQLLLQLFLKAHVDLGQLSDMLIAQNGIGSVLKQSCNDSDDEDDMELTEDSDVFGITSVINLTSHRETPCVQQFYALLDEMTAQHASEEVKGAVKKILDGGTKLGFLINERFVNIPAKISALMLNTLYEELERMKKKDKSYEFDYFILISKTSRPKGENEGEELFSNDEEEVFKKSADVTFDFSVENQCDSGLAGKWLSEDQQLTPFRRVIIFKGSQLKSIVDEITTLVQ
ncbi:protein BCCIP homolog [Anthonomus grandis grandis]|uniref:protein BCCIP homolog n=1 Tax=Anthonomus grandis grandis TaxID=2921223 RepID=UPI002165A7BE|nr:protein BCCIP homolog [Anthonomus grandis grandis]